MRRGLTLLLVLVGLLSGCAPSYTMEELHAGVEIDVDDPEGLITGAWLISIEALPDSVGAGEQIGRSSAGYVVFEPGVVLDRDVPFDVVVAYRTGPVCMIVPDVTVTSDDSDSIVIEVVSKQRGNCASAEYDEAIGIDFTVARNGRSVVVDHHR